MHKITFFPIGNADCCRIDLENGKKLLFDFAHYKIMENDDDLRIDLGKTIKEDLAEAERDYFDVVAFSHLDNDHIAAFGEYFYLEHAEKYQDEDRIKINELWVPAEVILESDLSGDARILRQEARYRLKKGSGIRVFSRPELLKEWLVSEGINPVLRANLITDAGSIVPNFQKLTDGIELFVHSPFAKRVDDNILDRNKDSLVFHITFLSGLKETKFFYVGDTECGILADIVNITNYHQRGERLKWDIFDIPHHCSYLALSEEKGDDKTEPIEEVQWLLDQGSNHGILVSCSKPIPNNDDDNQPPHRQAAKCYKECATAIDGEFRVTMEFPKKSKPSPMVIEIDSNGASVKKVITSGGLSAISRPAPRAGVSIE